MDARLYRCRECIGDGLFCASCLVKEHKRLPLHCIEVSDALSSGDIILINETVILTVLERSILREDFAHEFGLCPANGT